MSNCKGDETSPIHFLYVMCKNIGKKSEEHRSTKKLIYIFDTELNFIKTLLPLNSNKETLRGEAKFILLCFFSYWFVLAATRVYLLYLIT